MDNKSHNNDDIKFRASLLEIPFGSSPTSISDPLSPSRLIGLMLLVHLHRAANPVVSPEDGDGDVPVFVGHYFTRYLYY